MTPMVKTFAGLAGGWAVSRAIGLASRLQAGHGESNARKLQSRRLFTRNRWPTIDVTRRSIEETAAAILDLYRDHRLKFIAV